MRDDDHDLHSAEQFGGNFLSAKVSKQVVIYGGFSILNMRYFRRRALN